MWDFIGDGLAPLTRVRCRATSTPLARSNFSCSYFPHFIQLANEWFRSDRCIKAPDPWNDLTSRCHLGYIYTHPQMTVKAYPHTSVWVPIGCYRGPNYGLNSTTALWSF